MKIVVNKYFCCCSTASPLTAICDVKSYAGYGMPMGIPYNDLLVVVIIIIIIYIVVLDHINQIDRPLSGSNKGSWWILIHSFFSVLTLLKLYSCIFIHSFTHSFMVWLQCQLVSQPASVIYLYTECFLFSLLGIVQPYFQPLNFILI